MTFVSMGEPLLDPDPQPETSGKRDDVPFLSFASSRGVSSSNPFHRA
jgi:hypothetical protein